MEGPYASAHALTFSCLFRLCRGVAMIAVEVTMYSPTLTTLTRRTAGTAVKPVAPILRRPVLLPKLQNELYQRPTLIYAVM